MRWRHFSAFTKAVVGGGATALACGAVYYGCRSKSTKVEKPPALTGDEFNALQDQAMLRAALQKNHLPWTFHSLKSKNLGATNESLLTPRSSDDFLVTFYRLLGCPYCAKVQAVLQFYDVPYENEFVDPLSGRGLPDKRYELVPQLLFAPPPPASGHAADAEDSKKGVFLVDSSTIVTALAGPLGYTRELKDKRVEGTREWITSHFQSASFALTSGTLHYAYTSFPHVTPEYYHGFIYHVVGTLALYALANLKVKPRMIGDKHPFNQGYLMKQYMDAPQEDTEKATKELEKKLSARTPQAWLRDELGIFISRFEPNATFHGGATPDLADIEMYGVTRVVKVHESLAAITEEGSFGAWQKAVEEFMMKRNGHL